jgi:hypothetical protein
VTERVLLSPVDGAGAQLAWFIGPEDASGRTRILSVITLDPAGVVACVEMRGVATAEMPERRAIGFVHHVAGRALPHPVELLEAPISSGIRTLNEGIARNVTGGAPTPLAFRLLNPVLWIEGLTADDGAPPSSVMPDAGDADAVAALLDHPAFRGWHWWPADLPAEVRQGAPGGAGDARTFDPLRPALSRFGPEVSASYTRRLEAQSRWLTIAGDLHAAALARLAVLQLQAQPPEQASFVRRLTRAGREVAQLRDRSTM